MLSAVEKKSDQVYRWLLAYIDENKFSGNQRLPSENALCRKLGVSRETIRVAIDQLVAEGLVYKLKGLSLIHISPNDQRREQLALFEDIFFKLLVLIVRPVSYTHLRMWMKSYIRLAFWRAASAESILRTSAHPAASRSSRSCRKLVTSRCSTTLSTAQRSWSAQP